MSPSKTNKNVPLALFIFPPIYDFAFFDLFVKPFSLLRLARSFETAGYRIKIINCLDYRDHESIQSLGNPKRRSNGTGKMMKINIEKPEALKRVERVFSRYGILSKEIKKRLGEEIPDIILVSSGMTYWYMGVNEVVEAAHATCPEAPVIVGGVYASLLPEHCKRATGADYVVSHDTWGSLSAICTRFGLPDRLEEQKTIFIDDSIRDAACIRINRGCPFSCDYCASEMLSGNFKKGDADEVFAIVEEIHRKLGTKNFAFYDDALLACKEDAFLLFLNKVADSKMQLSFYLPNGIHLRYFDYEIARMMKQVGFKELRFGFESSDERFHQNHDMKLSPSNLEEKITIAKDAGFTSGEISAYILAGLPGQYKEEVEDSIRHVSRLGIRARICEYSPIPGSALWEKSICDSSFPLAEEPLVHNNSILPMRWDGFTYRDLEDMKDLARSLFIRNSSREA
jgi:radical SAM superfamily enzyme YgiQ (UPF0313 family)